MAMLSSGPIWVLVVRAKFDQLTEAFEASGDLANVIMHTDGEDIRTVATLTTDDDPQAAAWEITRALAGLWGMVPPEVPCRTTVHHHGTATTWVTGGPTMLGLLDGEGLDWWAERVEVVGG